LNGVLDPNEECDLSSPGGAFCVGGPCNTDCSCPDVTTTTTTVVVTTTTAASSTTTTEPNHFQCYETRRGPAAGNSVTLEDQFGSSTAILGRTNRLCAPANKNGEDPTAPDDPNHLRSYQVRNRFTKILDQTIVNQFGTLVVDVVKPQFIFVPATKSFLGPPAPPTAPTADHFQCYKIRRHRGAPKFQKILGVSIEDQFGPATLDLLKARWLCAPTNKNGEDPSAPGHPSHLLCYKARNAISFAQRDAFLTDQFRSDQVFLKRRVEFCVPSLKNPTVTTTTTLQATTTTTVQTPTTTTGPATTTTAAVTTTTTTSSTTTTTVYGSPSRAFMEPVPSLLD
jgi:hypothetical protein